MEKIQQKWLSLFLSYILSQPEPGDNKIVLKYKKLLHLCIPIPINLILSQQNHQYIVT